MCHKLLLVFFASMFIAAGCEKPATSKTAGNYQTISTDPYQDTALATKLNAEAVNLTNEGKLDEAEQKLKAALQADLMYGLAHNNLGTIYYKQQKYYQAAWEFDYAIKLMPNRVEPKNNLAMVLESVGKYEESKKYYEEALKIEPDNYEIAANLARLHIRNNNKDERTRQLLQEIQYKDTRQQWIDWANSLLLNMENQTMEPPVRVK